MLFKMSGYPIDSNEHSFLDKIWNKNGTLSQLYLRLGLGMLLVVERIKHYE